MRTGQAVVGVFGVLWLWVLFASNLRLGIRFGISALVIATGLAAALTLRIEGVSGDLVPVLGWRFSKSSTPQAPSPRGRSAPVSSTPSSAEPARLEPTPTDSPQFLGSLRNGEVLGVTLAKDWKTTPPREVWRRAVGDAWSSFAVVGAYAFTQEQRGESECVVAYRLSTGDEIWAHGVAARYDNVVGGIGPRATPTVHEGTVYTLGATGKLSALEASRGTPRWQRDVVADEKAKVAEWGISGSPLLHKGRLFIHVAGRLLAYDPTSGERLWGTDPDRWGYASPFVATLAGVEQIVSFHGRRISGHDLDGGRTLWSHPWETRNPTASQPMVVARDRLFVSSGYGTGCELLQLLPADDGALRVKSLWRTKRLKAKFTNVIIRGGFAYGLDDGVLVCLDLETGERRWKSGRYGHGQTLGLGPLLLVQAESGTVVLLEASPESARELGRLEALAGKTWNHATVAGNRLLVRNNREAACYELPLASGPGTYGTADTQ